LLISSSFHLDFLTFVHRKIIRLPAVSMSSPQPLSQSSGNQTGMTGAESRSTTTSQASASDDDQTAVTQELWADIAASLMKISMNNRRLGKPSSQSLIQLQIVVKCQALDREHDWKSAVPEPERAEIRKAVERAQKHCNKLPQDQAVGRLIFAIFFENVELKDLDMNHLVSCIAESATPDNALAPSVA
jgi:hypothetical protein